MEQSCDVLAFSAHPDDVELMCAGTLIKLARKGYKTGVVSLTAGEMGTRGTPELRQKENEQAAKIMNVSVNRILDIPDGSIENNRKNQLKIIKEIREYRPKIVLTPYWETRHPDHGNCSLLVRQAAFFSGLKNIDTGQPHYRPTKVIYYMELYDFKPSFIVDVSDTFEDKIKAIQVYASQFHNPEKEYDYREATYISTPEFLRSIIARGEYWGNKIGAHYGEPFLVREPMKLNDPIAHFSDYTFAGLL
ncbi:bacillithiol biosynthesis deacetylase BshB1 [candidate division KSB1 bacterium]|nr:bacillithiol biosynthesis deacetylase BshB1 [candidate division KSB1 bacterium]